MSSAGTQLNAGRIPGERIATTVETADSATFTTTETQIMSVTASLVTGRTYRIRLVTRIGTTVAGDSALVRMREDNTSGTELSVDNWPLASTGAAANPVVAEGEYTAVSTANKTFVAAALRQTGTGNLFREAASTRPSFLYVDYIR